MPHLFCLQKENLRYFDASTFMHEIPYEYLLPTRFDGSFLQL